MKTSPTVQPLWGLLLGCQALPPWLAGQTVWGFKDWCLRTGGPAHAHLPARAVLGGGAAGGGPVLQPGQGARRAPHLLQLRLQHLQRPRGGGCCLPWNTRQPTALFCCIITTLKTVYICKGILPCIMKRLAIVKVWKLGRISLVSGVHISHMANVHAGRREGLPWPQPGSTGE